MLDGVVERTLVLCISMVDVSTQFNEQLDCAYVALSSRVVDTSLSILVLAVDVVLAVVHKVLNRLIVTLSTRIKDRSLL